MRSIYGVTIPLQPAVTPVALFKALANPKRIQVLRCLHRCKFATNKVIAKYTGIPQPQVSAALKKLLQADLVTKEKVGTQWLYELNEPVWSKLQHVLA